jgi:hypothetical protein
MTCPARPASIAAEFTPVRVGVRQGVPDTTCRVGLALGPEQSAARRHGRVPGPLVFTFARTTGSAREPPREILDMGVGFIKGMPAHTGHLREIARRKRVPAQLILAWRNQFQVVRVHAMPHAAEMIDFTISGNGSPESDVGVSVPARMPLIKPELAITPRSERAPPQPARRRSLDFRPEPYVGILWVLRHRRPTGPLTNPAPWPAMDRASGV